jgi:anti-anti-sigma factor
MPVKKWSESILLVDLCDDPLFTEDIVAAMEQVQANPAVDVVLNFDGVRFVNSSNLAKMLKLRRITIENERRLVCCTVDSHAWSIFLTTGLDKIFQFTDDVSTALALLQIAQQKATGGPDKP